MAMQFYIPRRDELFISLKILKITETSKYTKVWWCFLMLFLMEYRTTYDTDLPTMSVRYGAIEMTAIFRTMTINYYCYYHHI